MQVKYNHKEVESKWRSLWLKKNTVTPQSIKTPKNKFYNLWMFPYPSAEGLHAGHAFSSTGSDVYGRYKRMNNFEVFQPIGYDSFGIHSENYAIKTKKHPGTLIKKTTETYEAQLKSVGHGYDWEHTVTTSDVDYYRWTQWIFVEMFKAGLAYRKESEVNFCPSCKTVLSDEQVVTPKAAGKGPFDASGKEAKGKPNALVCERCGTIVEKRSLVQWFFRITDYADRLLTGLEKINWPERIKTAQRNWIGKKAGIKINYKVAGTNLSIDCWTSRPDTNFGSTFVVLSPEHPLALTTTTEENRESVLKYIEVAQKKSKEDRLSEGRAKTGVFTGAFAINNLTNEKMPIWISDFVLMDVGTGAVIGVPGHDKRDFEFAKKYKIPVKRVVVGPDGEKGEIKKIDQVQDGDGVMINSDFLDGKDSVEAKEIIMNHLEENKQGVRNTYFHLRDWTISRQRYWGPPIPMIFCSKCKSEGKSWFTEKPSNILHSDQSDWNHAGWYPEENLPVELPNIKDYEPEGTGKGPLANHPEFYKVACPECGSAAQRETDVSDTFLDSAWYFLRYPSTHSARSGQVPFDPEITKAWLPVDLYFGGAEHAVLHLMYARFLTMALHDLKKVVFEEPFPNFYAHGLMIKDGAKMSKSRGNVVNPDEYIKKFGADTLRLYLMFMGPMDGYPDFRDTGIEGMRRFVEKIWQLYQLEDSKIHLSKDQQNVLNIKMHQTIKKVTDDIEGFRYNTAISAIMEYVNLLRDLVLSHQTSAVSKLQKITPKTESRQLIADSWSTALKNLALLLAPFAPHLTEEIWAQMGLTFSIHRSDWPKYDHKYVQTSTVQIAVQVNGKLRATIEVESSLKNEKTQVVNIAKKHQNVTKWLKKKEINNTIFVPGKIVNFVVASK